MKTYVVDASVASRFLLVEDLSDKAASLLKSFHEGTVELKAPRIVKYEVGNTLWKAAKQRLIGVNEALERFSYFLRLRLDCIELNEQECVETLVWGVRNAATYYDSVYVEASKKIRAALLTADDTLYEKALKEVETLHLRDL